MEDITPIFRSLQLSSRTQEQKVWMPTQALGTQKSDSTV